MLVIEIKDYFRIFLYGPGYNRSKPSFRLGDPRDLPNVSYEIYNPKITPIYKLYIVVQLLGFITEFAKDYKYFLKKSRKNVRKKLLKLYFFSNSD